MARRTRSNIDTLESQVEDVNKLIAAGGGKTPVKQVTGQTANASYVNMRKEPSVHGEVLHTLPMGTGVGILGDGKSQWVEVMYKGEIGFIDRRYLKVPNQPWMDAARSNME